MNQVCDLLLTVFECKCLKSDINFIMEVLKEVIHDFNEMRNY